MSWHDRHPSAYDQEHERELRKHDFEPLPHRLDRQISTAEDIALCVRALRNLAEGAALIEQYAQMKASIAVADLAAETVKRLGAGQ
jgi:hypothetical protein